ncbi:hypothetical protein ACVWW4_001275 [Bradyrhizobium sp. LB7.1]
MRKSIGRELHGDSANHAWGVMDVLAVTDFPDIRFKALIQSAKDGSLLIIPREGGYMVRLYVELAKLDIGERVTNRNITAEDVIAKAQRILTPHTLEVKEIAWWSVYEIGQRLTDKFDDVPEAEINSRLPRIFIAGDACHTHSPKAGQGMNVSMQDAFNLGWKLAAVLRKQSAPSLLHSYSAERQAVAKELIDFDREWAGILASGAKAGGADAARTQAYFVKHGRYTAGTATQYRPSILTGATSHQHLAQGLVIGARFHSAPVIRLADAKPVHLGHAAQADGRFRIYAFSPAEDPAAEGSAIRALCNFLSEARESPVRRHTACRSRHRQRDRPAGGVPAGSSRARRRGDARTAAPAQRPLRLDRLREDVLSGYQEWSRRFHHARRRPQGRLHGRGAAGSIRRDRAADR